MSLNRAVLLRISTIDRCLQNRYRRWTREDLIDACSEALAEYEGRYERVSRRTFQNDLALMRSDRLGYNAPIVVRDRKYYEYEDPSYSISHLPLNSEDVAAINQALEFLRSMDGFPELSSPIERISRLNESITPSILSKRQIIDLEQGEGYPGSHLVGVLYSAILNRRTLLIDFRPSGSVKNGKIKHGEEETLQESTGEIQDNLDKSEEYKRTVYPLLLKEYRNRWFLLGRTAGAEKRKVDIFALDRIVSVNTLPGYPFEDMPEFDAQTYFADTIGVSRRLESRPEKIRILVGSKQRDYLESRPLHKSQRIEKRNEDGSIVIVINVIINRALESLLMGYGPGITVISPEHLRSHLADLFRRALGNYADTPPAKTK